MWGLIPVLVVLGDMALPPTTFGWDFANLVALAAGGVALLLFIETGRPRPRPPFEGRYFINLHRDLGIVVIILVTLHGVYVLVDEPTTVEYLLPTAPLYMLAGLVSYLLLIALVVLGFKRVRVAAFPNHRVFRITHWVSALAFVALAWWHVLGADYYLRTDVVAGIMIVASIAVLVVWVLKRQVPRRETGNGRRIIGVAHYPEWMAAAATVAVVLSIGAFAVLRVV